MRVVIPSSGRAATLTTPAWLATASPPIPYTVVVHSEDARASYVLAGRVPEDRIVVSHQPPGVQHQRQWIEDNLVGPGEWYVSLDDNVRRMTAVPRPQWDQLRLPVQADPSLRAVYATPLSADAFFRERVTELVAEATMTGARLVGFAPTDNFYFCGVKYRSVGYVSSKVMLRCRSEVRWDPAQYPGEDIDQTCAHLWTFGCVLVCNYIRPVAPHYEPGGIGTFAERLPAKLVAMQRLVRKWPGLIRLKPRHGVTDADHQLRLHSPRQIAAWRSTCRPSGAASLP